ncbi:MAG: hypothetical protein ABI904_13385 [Chloroflexota bacterium]
MSNITPTCSHCGKSLINQTCFACAGNGFSREFLLVHKECDVCHGSGRIWRCEDEFKHVVDDFKNAHTVEHKPLSQTRRKRITPEFSQHSEITPHIPPAYPMHPENPWGLNNALGSIKITSPKNINNPGHPLNRNNPINRSPVKK